MPQLAPKLRCVPTKYRAELRSPTIRLSTISTKKMSTNGSMQGRFASELLQALRTVEETEPEDEASEKRDSVLEDETAGSHARWNPTHAGVLKRASENGRGARQLSTLQSRSCTTRRLPSRAQRQVPGQRTSSRSTTLSSLGPPPDCPLPALPAPAKLKAELVVKTETVSWYQRGS